MTAMTPLHGFEIAIIGMAGRFPGANTLEQFWHNVSHGIESIQQFSDAALRAAGIAPVLLEDPHYVKAGAILDNIDHFDAAFFGLTPQEAETLDPQHRLFLECAWEALEHAGYDAEKYAGSIGVYAGAAMNTYLAALGKNPPMRDSAADYLLGIGNDKDFVPTRVSYKLQLRGPSVNVQTACSTSLVAVHLACQSLLSGECTMALAGAVSLYVPQQTGYLYQPGMVYSPDGHCRAFDIAAQGTVGGNGLGIVVLKRLADALADGDTIHAVIKSSAINNDGAHKIGFTAPSVEGQAAVIQAALALAEVHPESVRYLEAHGTATALGDPVEVAALTQAFRTQTARQGFCALGSVKTNIGHLNTAAGIAGLIKTVLALQHRQIPPSLHFTQANPLLELERSPFYVNTTLAEWPAHTTPRRAGVSSFGIGGTNAHMILEEAPQGAPPAPSRPWQLLLWSAITATALDAMTTRLAAHLRQHPELPLADVAFTLHLGRKPFPYRRMLVCQDTLDACRALESADAHRLLTATLPGQGTALVWMFPGQGAQYVPMTRQLYEQEPSFRAVVDQCAEMLTVHLGCDLREVLYPQPAQVAAAEQQLRQTALAQPALFVVAYALATVLMELGVQPQAMIGHSLGEYVAACLAGVFSLPDALALVSARGRLMQQLPAGAMLSVSLSLDALQPWLSPDLAVAAHNGPELCVVAGPEQAIVALETRLVQRGVLARRLHTSHAFHSAMMEPILAPFTELLRSIPLHPPGIPYVSNVTGTWILESQATDPHYWAIHLRQTVRFAEGLQTVLSGPDSLCVEVGPGQTLSALHQQHPAGQHSAVIATLPHAHSTTSELAFFLEALGKLWLAGVPLAWAPWYRQEQRQRQPLPTYPFERQRYWLESVQGETDAPAAPERIGKKPDLADWFYIPSWKRAALPPAGALPHGLEPPSTWLLFLDPCGLGAQLMQRLHSLGQQAIGVHIGQDFCQMSDTLYSLNPQSRSDYDRLVQALRATGHIPQKIVHAWQVTAEVSEPHMEAVDAAQFLGLYSLIFLAQALGEQEITTPMRLVALSNHLHDVLGDEVLCPAKATVLGACKILPLEYPNMTCCSVDITLPAAPASTVFLDALLGELTAPGNDVVIAQRGAYRWVQTFEPMPLPAASALPLREQGTYLITGGLGGVGLALAEWFAKTLRANLVLTGRSPFPPRATWAQWLAMHDEDDRTSHIIRRLQACEAWGSTVLVCQADVAVVAQMQAVMTQVQQQLGALHGVVHSAGVADYAGIMQRRSVAMTASVLAPKVTGTLVLDSLLRETPLDFVVLCSTLGTVLYHSKFGEVGYCAANEFLDAYAYAKKRQGGPVTITVNWTDWQEVGMSVEAARRRAERYQLAYDPAGLADGLYTAEGQEVLRRILAQRFPRVLVSCTDLARTLRHYEAASGPVLPSVVTEALRERPKHARPALQQPLIVPSDAVEHTLVSIWEGLLGFAPLGIHDNFFDLGGNSLLGIQVISRLRDALQVELSLRQLFETPTIAALAVTVMQRQMEQGNQETMKHILSELEALSEEQAYAQLGQEKIL